MTHAQGVASSYKLTGNLSSLIISYFYKYENVARSHAHPISDEVAAVGAARLASPTTMRRRVIALPLPPVLLHASPYCISLRAHAWLPFCCMHPPPQRLVTRAERQVRQPDAC